MNILQVENLLCRGILHGASRAEAKKQYMLRIN